MKERVAKCSKLTELRLHRAPTLPLVDFKTYHTCKSTRNGTHLDISLRGQRSRQWSTWLGHRVRKPKSTPDRYPGPTPKMITQINLPNSPLQLLSCYTSDNNSVILRPLTIANTHSIFFDHKFQQSSIERGLFLQIESQTQSSPKTQLSTGLMSGRRDNQMDRTFQHF